MLLNNPLKSVYENTLEEFKHSSQDIIQDITEDINMVNGRTLVKIKDKAPDIAELSKKYLLCLKDSFRKSEDFKKKNIQQSNVVWNVEKLTNRVADKIINIRLNKPFKECLEETIKYRDLLKENFYGVLFVTADSKKTVINPFHTLTALSVLEHDEYLRKNYNILIYAYTNRQAFEKLIESQYGDKDKCRTNIKLLMRIYSNRATEKVRYTNISYNSYTERFICNKDMYKHKDETPYRTSYLVATGIGTDGIMFPYYASSLIWIYDNSSYSNGCSLSPFNTCNISSYFDNTIDKSDSSIDTLQESSVCTGSNSNSSIIGFRSLGIANFSSPFGSHNLTNASLIYADTMIEESIKLYKMVELLDKNTIVEHVKKDTTEYVDNTVFWQNETNKDVLKLFGQYRNELLQNFTLSILLKSSSPKTLNSICEKYNSIKQDNEQKIQLSKTISSDNIFTLCNNVILFFKKELIKYTKSMQNFSSLITKDIVEINLEEQNDNWVLFIKTCRIKHEDDDLFTKNKKEVYTSIINNMYIQFITVLNYSSLFNSTEVTYDESLEYTDDVENVFELFDNVVEKLCEEEEDYINSMYGSSYSEKNMLQIFINETNRNTRYLKSKIQ